LGTAAVIVGCACPRRALRIAMGLAVAVIVAVIAVTRLYLGVHWLTDVIGGLLLGALAVTLGYLALRQLPGITGRRTFPQASQPSCQTRTPLPRP
jgi:membrane-associated phospholipid phosphatase